MKSTIKPKSKKIRKSGKKNNTVNKKKKVITQIKGNPLKRSRLSPNKTLQSDVFPIVGIGASAGGLEEFEKLLSHIPKTLTGVSYVIITHLDRNHASVLPDLLRKFTPLPVVKITNSMKIKRNTIYVIPTKKNIEIKLGVLKLIEQEEPHHANMPISYFFRSLAENSGEHAIAIILSGSGTDGSLGLRDIKENGGLIIVQDPATASFDSMPRCALNTGLVDYVLKVEDIPLQIKKYLSYGKMTEGKSSPEL